MKNFDFNSVLHYFFLLQVQQVDAYTNSEQLSKIGKQKEFDGVLSPSNILMGNVCIFSIFDKLKLYFFYISFILALFH